MSYKNRTLPILVPILVLSAAASLTAEESWGRFRGRNATGIAGRQIPTHWSDTENLAWRTALPGRGSSSPVIHGNLIFLTTYSGYGQSTEAPETEAS